jgi:hypothetical protein
MADLPFLAQVSKHSGEIRGKNSAAVYREELGFSHSILTHFVLTKT